MHSDRKFGLALVFLEGHGHKHFLKFTGALRAVLVHHFVPVIRVFVAVGASDLRRGFDGLAQLARDQLEQDPMTGHLFVFANRKRDRIKILYWDQSGFAIWMKRLEQGRFNWPASDAARVEWSGAELAAVLGGIDLKDTRKRKRFALAAS